MKKTFLFCLTLIVSCSANTGHSEKIPGAIIEAPPSNIFCTGMCFDSNGFIWIGTQESGLFHFDGTNYIHYVPSDEDGSLCSSKITRIFYDSKQTLWVGTNNGMDIYNPQSKSFRHIQIRGNNKNISGLAENGAGQVLITTGDGGFVYDESSDAFKKVIDLDTFNLIKLYTVGNDIYIVNNWSIDRYGPDFQLMESYPSSMAISTSWQISPNIIIVKSFPHIQIFDTNKQCFTPLAGNLSEFNNPDKLSFISTIEDNSIIFAYDGQYYSYDFNSDVLMTEEDDAFPFVPEIRASSATYIRKDEKGDFWISTHTKGVLKAKPAINTQFFPLEKYAGEHQIKSIVSYKEKIWMISDSHYLVSFDPETKNLKVNDIGQIIGRVLGGERWCDIYLDKTTDRLFLSVDNNIWECIISSDGELDVDKLYSMTYVSDFSRCVVDKSGGLWAGGTRGTLQYAELDTPAKSTEFTDVNLNGLTLMTELSALTCLDDGIVAAAFSNSAIGFINPLTKENHVIYIPSNERIGNIVSLCSDYEGTLWIGTADRGLYLMDPQNGQIKHSKFLSEGRISHIQRDDNGRMFLISGSNLFQFVPSTGTFKTLLVSTGVSSAALNVQGKDEILAYLGGNLNILERNTQSQVSKIPEIRNVLVTDEKGHLLDIWELDKDSDKKIVLSENRNNVRLSISATELMDCSYLHCRVMLEGVFRDYRDFSETTFSLENLPYGRHKLSFCLVNPAENSFGQVHDIMLVIPRPWYISDLAKLSLLLVALSLLLFILHLVQSNKESRLKIQLAEEEKEMQKRLNQENIDFFTDISHEFRTPLTIISGSAETILQDPQISSRQSHLAHMIQRNTDRMLKLVGQLMDLNKLDHGKLELRVRACDVNETILSISDAFINISEQKNLCFTAHCPDYLLCWMDSDKFEKMVYNLLSNAFKYTPSGGSVTIDAKIGNADDLHSLFPEQKQPVGNYLIVTVSDTGIGIPDEKKTAVFTRFTRVNPDSRTGGTGIGLSFTKSLVEAHHGYIGMTDRKDENGNEKGSVFFFALPADKSAYNQQELSIEECRQTDIDSMNYKSEYTIHPLPATNSGNRIKIMVIDDDSEILYYLSIILSPDYEVITRSDAISGYKKIEETEPDVIISDIMMVEMDGLKLCRMVKDEISLSHIPFILLTAKATTQDQIEGMNAGADAYIVKPFDPNYLKAVITSLLRNRDNVRKALGASTSIEKVEVEEDAISQQDKKILEKLYAIMEEHLMESELNISEMTVNLGMSRTKLYYKIKGLTGQTPNEFFKTFKLNKAAEMIKEGKYKISAISDMVGFSSPSHFAAAFQKQFGKLPSKY